MEYQYEYQKENRKNGLYEGQTLSYEDDNQRHWDDGLSVEEKKKNIEEAKKSRDALTLNILETIKGGENELTLEIVNHISENAKYFDMKNYPAIVFLSRLEPEVSKTIDILKSMKNPLEGEEIVMSIGNFMARMMEDYFAIKKMEAK